MADFPAILGGAVIDHADAPSGSRGINITAGGSAHTKTAAWAELIASTTAPSQWVIVTLRPSTSSAASFTVDIGIGASSNEKVLIPDLFVEAAGSQLQGVSRAYCFPLFIRAGARLSARAQCTTASLSVAVSVILVGGTMIGGSPLSRVESCGVLTSANTRLTAVDPGGVAHTDSGWTELIASTGFPYKWMLCTTGHGASATGVASAYLIDLAVGANPNEKPIFSDICTFNGTGTDSPTQVVSAPLSVPSGSRLSARLRSSSTTATDRILDVALWGVG